MKNILLLCLLLLPFEAFALRLQLLHTNDLHSYFDGTRNGKGGYAKIKALADSLKAKAKETGMKTLFVDGGDFGEGTSFFMANNGVDALQMIDALGIQVTVLGNHDYMQGGRELAKQMEAANLKAKIVSANLRGEWLMGLRGKIPDMVTINYEGVKIGIFGLSTAEAHYQYPILNTGLILPPATLLPAMELKAKLKKVDFLMALTHIGFAKDVEIVKKSKRIDLVVGGHSHTRLEDPILAKNKNGEDIPVLQTGANSLALGEMIIDIDPVTKKHQFISYKLHDITADIPDDKGVRDLVEIAKVHREDYFKRAMDEVIGESKFTLHGSVDGIAKSTTSCWGSHLAKMTHESVKADVGLHVANFEGEQIPAGPIRYVDMIDNFPHFREFNDGGWEIVTIKLNGFLLKKIFEFAAKAPGQFGLNFSGVDMPKNGMESGFDFKINGKKINPLKDYRLAMPSEVIYAVESTIPWLKGILYTGRRYTGVKYWEKLEDYIRVNSPLRCGQVAQN
ncbi:MAG: metallophosphoesterase [Bacteriovoracaceae bacterium]|nr:metallophosphoesterase [Bacteriovoracaceae bacterium]